MPICALAQLHVSVIIIKESKVCCACALAVPSNKRRRLRNLASREAFTVYWELAASVDRATDLLDSGGTDADIVCTICLEKLRKLRVEVSAIETALISGLRH